MVVKHHSYYIKWSVCLILKKLKNLFSALLACLLYIPQDSSERRKEKSFRHGRKRRKDTSERKKEKERKFRKKEKRNEWKNWDSDMTAAALYPHVSFSSI